MIVGCMLLFTVQALGELAVLYPVNGAFYQYAVRFLDPAWYAPLLPSLVNHSSLGDLSNDGIKIGVLQWVGIMPFRGL